MRYCINWPVKLWQVRISLFHSQDPWQRHPWLLRKGRHLRELEFVSILISWNQANMCQLDLPLIHWTVYHWKGKVSIPSIYMWWTTRRMYSKWVACFWETSQSCPQCQTFLVSGFAQRDDCWAFHYFVSCSSQHALHQCEWPQIQEQWSSKITMG